MNRGEWETVCALLNDHEVVPLYDGCIISGGVASSKDDVLSILRKRFVNQSLFTDAKDHSIIGSFEGHNAYMLNRMLNLVGAQRRDDASSFLGKGLTTFARAAAAGEGSKFAIDVPYFMCICYVYPSAWETNDVVFLFCAQWMTGVC